MVTAVPETWAETHAGAGTESWDSPDLTILGVARVSLDDARGSPGVRAVLLGSLDARGAARIGAGAALAATGASASAAVGFAARRAVQYSGVAGARELHRFFGVHVVLVDRHGVVTTADLVGIASAGHVALAFAVFVVVGVVSAPALCCPEA